MEQLGAHIETTNRSQPIGLIGDLDGKYENMINHMLHIGVITSGEVGTRVNIPIWTGGNTKVILSGDILADRNCDGFQIMLAIRSLREQAQKQGGDIIVLAGNHDDRMIGYLIGKYDINTWDEIIATKSNTDHRGMNELLGFLSELEIGLTGKTKRIKILENMQKYERGKMILEEICKMKLVHLEGDSIHFHTQPSIGVLDRIKNYIDKNGNLKDSIDRINFEWQLVVKNILLKDISSKGNDLFMKASKRIYWDFANIFLHALNGTENHIKGKKQDPNNHQDKITPNKHIVYDVMRDSGIKCLYHGHTIDPRSKFRISGIRITNLNRKSMRISGNKSSRGTDITKKGVLQRIGDLLSGK